MCSINLLSTQLNHLKLYGMANAFRTQLEIADAHQLSFEERFALLVDAQFTWRENRALEHRLRNAKLKQKAPSKTSTINIPAGWIASSCAPWPAANGYGKSKMFSSSVPPALVKVGSAVPWRRKPAVTVSPL